MASVLSSTPISVGKISASSDDSVNASFDLFNVPHTNTSSLNGAYTIYPPIRQARGHEDLTEIFVTGSEDHYVDLHNSYLYIECKVQKNDGSNIPTTAADHKLGMGDNFFHSLWGSMDFKIGQTTVEYRPNYAHTAYVENLIYNSKEVKETRLYSTSGWIEDKGVGKHFDELSDGIKAKRRARLAGSKTLAFYGRPMLDMFKQERYLAAGLGFSLSMRRSPANICLFDGQDAAPTGGAKIEITKCELHVRKVSPNPGLHRAQTTELLDGSTLYYPLQRVKTQFQVVTAGVQDVRLSLEQNSQKPTKVIVGLIDHAAKTGRFDRNPFKFEHFDLSSISLDINGLPVAKQYEPNFPSDMYAIEYARLIAGAGKSHSKSGNGITYEEFKEGKALYVFDTTPDLSTEGFHLISNASLTLNIRFRQALTTAVSVFIYQVKNDLVSIDAEHRVQMIAGAL